MKKLYILTTDEIIKYTFEKIQYNNFIVSYLNRILQITNFKLTLKEELST